MAFIKQLKNYDRDVYPITTTDAVLFAGTIPITDAIRQLMLPNLYYGAKIRSFSSSGQGTIYESDRIGTRGILDDIVDQFKPCVAKGNKIQYYLSKYDLNEKADGSDAVLDGTDGTVRIHTPKFYGFLGWDSTNENYELCVSAQQLDENWLEIPEMLIDAYVCTKTERGWESIVNLTGENVIAADPIAEMANIPEGSQLVDYMVWKWIFIFLRILDTNCINPCTDGSAPWPYAPSAFRSCDSYGDSWMGSYVPAGSAGIWNGGYGTEGSIVSLSGSESTINVNGGSYNEQPLERVDTYPKNTEIWYRCAPGNSYTPATNATVVSDVFNEELGYNVVTFDSEITRIDEGIGSPWDIILPDSVTNLGFSCFNNLYLNNLYLGSGLVEIGENAFNNDSVMNIYCKATTPPSDTYGLLINHRSTIYVLKSENQEILKAYKNADGWKDYYWYKEYDGKRSAVDWTWVYSTYKVNWWRYFENPDGFGTKLLPDVMYQGYYSSEREYYILKLKQGDVIATDSQYSGSELGFMNRRQDYFSPVELASDDAPNEVCITGDEYCKFSKNCIAYNGTYRSDYVESEHNTDGWTNVSYNAAIIPSSGKVEYGNSTVYAGTCSITNLYIGNPQYAIDKLDNRYSVRTYSKV